MIKKICTEPNNKVFAMQQHQIDCITVRLSPPGLTLTVTVNIKSMKHSVIESMCKSSALTHYFNSFDS